MRHYYEVRAINPCGNVEMVESESCGPNCADGIEDRLALTIARAYLDYPGCRIVVERG